MKQYIILAILTCALISPLFVHSAHAIDPDTTEIAKPIIEIQNPYAFATLPGATTGAAFMVLKNTGDLDDKLIGAQSKVAEITEIHQNLIDPDDGTMMMRKIKNIPVPIGEQVLLEPKGYHVMFIKMKQALAIGKDVEVTLIFEKAGEKKISIPVVAPGIKPKAKKVMPWDTIGSDVETTKKAKKTPEERIDY